MCNFLPNIAKKVMILKLSNMPLISPLSSPSKDHRKYQINNCNKDVEKINNKARLVKQCVKIVGSEKTPKVSKTVK